MARCSLKSVLLLLSTLFVCLPAYSQDTSARRLILHVTVSDDKQRAVQGLSQNAFAVTVDKTPQSIIGFSDASVPVSVGVVFDDSSSMRRGDQKASAAWRTSLIEGLSQFFKNSHPENEYFSGMLSKTGPTLSDWTSEMSKIEESIPPLKGEGYTALYDFCDRAIHKLQTGRHAKKILLILTDGVDSTSKLSFKRFRDQLRDSDIALYPIVTIAPIDAGSSLGVAGETVMMELAEVTGGRVLMLPANSNPEIVSDLFATLAREIRAQYQLIVEPQLVAEKRPKTRGIKVSATQSDTSGRPNNLRTRTRQALIQ